jgi:hypothetical protein
MRDLECLLGMPKEEIVQLYRLRREILSIAVGPNGVTEILKWMDARRPMPSPKGPPMCDIQPARQPPKGPHDGGR